MTQPARRLATERRNSRRIANSRVCAAFLVFGVFAIPTAASADPNTCVQSAPNGNTLTLHDQPDTRSAVLGGIGVGQCGLRVTNQCEGSWCVVVFQSLDGWAQMQFIAGSPVTPPAFLNGRPDAFDYVVTGGSGTVTIGGLSQATPVDPGGTVSVNMETQTRAVLTLPPQMSPDRIALARQGDGTWQGRMATWGGIPLPINVTFQGMGAPSASMVLSSSGPPAAMRMTIELAATGGRPSQAVVPSPSGGGAAPSPVTNPCNRLDALTRTLNRLGSTEVVQELRGIYTIAGLVSQSGSPTADRCQAALDMIDQSTMLQNTLAGVRPGSRTPGAGGNTSRRQAGAACGRIQAIAAAVEQANDLQISEIFGSSVDATGIMDLFAATEVQCARLLELLQMEGLGDPSAAFAAAQNGGQSKARPVPTPTPAPARAQSLAPCRVLGDRLRPILRGSDAALRQRVMTLLVREAATDFGSAAPATCALVLATLIVDGVLIDDGVGWAGWTPSDSAALRPDPSDFIPEQNSGLADSGPRPDGPAPASNACLQLADAMVVAIRLGLRSELARFREILMASDVRSISTDSFATCEAALINARQAGLAE